MEHGISSLSYTPLTASLWMLFERTMQTTTTYKPDHITLLIVKRISGALVLLLPSVSA